MPCRSCGSKIQGNFASEINIHFPGLKGLDLPTVLVFPRLVICLDCGFVEFESRIEKAELSLLEEGLVLSECTKRAEGTVA